MPPLGSDPRETAPPREEPKKICPKSTPELVGIMMRFMEQLTSVRLYNYQRVFVARVVESVLENDGAIITALWSRQSGKTEALALLAVALVLLLPALAREFEDDPRLVPFTRGFRIGIFAPIDEQAKISYNRMREFLAKPAAEEVMRDQDIDVVVTTNRGDTLAFSNGSMIQARSASPDSQIEGKTFELVMCEESQKLGRAKVDKEIRPMLASTNGSMVKIGTAWESKGGFHTDIARNVELMKRGGKRSHFEFPYDRVIREKQEQFRLDKNPFHLRYEKFVQSEITRIGGTDSPEFKMNFRCLWQETQVTAVTEAMLEKGKLYESETGIPRAGFQVAGLDLGKQNDRTVLTLGTVMYESPILNLVTGRDADADKQIYYRKQIHDWLELEGAFEGSSGQYQMIVSYLRMTQVKVLCIDSTGLGGDVITERLMDMLGESIQVVPFPFNSSSKSNLYKYYLQELQSGRLLFPAGPATRQDPRYSRFLEENLSLDKETRGSLIAVSATEGSHDDYPDSAALMCWAERVAQQVMLPTMEINVRGDRGGAGPGFESAKQDGSRYGRRGYLK